MDVSLDNRAKQLFQGKIQIKQLAEAAAMIELVGETAAGFGDFSGKFDRRDVWIVAFIPDVTEQTLKIAVELAPGGVNSGFEIGAGMAGLENLEKTPKVLQQAVF